MSTLALRAAGIIASAVQAKSGSSLVERFLTARENQAKQHVRKHLAAMDDAWLVGLGFTNDDIRALRFGELRLPS